MRWLERLLCKKYRIDDRSIVNDLRKYSNGKICSLSVYGDGGINELVTILKNAETVILLQAAQIRAAEDEPNE